MHDKRSVPIMITIFSWGYWGWGTTAPKLLQAIDATEAARGYGRFSRELNSVKKVNNLNAETNGRRLMDSEYFPACPSTDTDIGSIGMDHRSLIHHFGSRSQPGKARPAIQQ
jgi:hypothetical protein